MLRGTAGSEVEKISMYAVGFQTGGSIQDHATMPCLAHKPRTLTTANLTFLPPNSPSCTPWTSPRVKCHGTTRFSSRRPLRWQPSTPAGRLPGLLWSWPCRRTGSPSSTLYWVWYWLLCNRLCDMQIVIDYLVKRDSANECWFLLLECFAPVCLQVCTMNWLPFSLRYCQFYISIFCDMHLQNPIIPHFYKCHFEF